MPHKIFTKTRTLAVVFVVASGAIHPSVASAADASPATAATTTTEPAHGLKPLAADGSYKLPSVAEINAWLSVIKPALGTIYSLDQFGKIDSAKNAQAALEAAEQHILSAGGGILVIPVNTDWSWKPKSTAQREFRNPPPPASTTGWREGTGITMVDARGSKPTLYPSPITGLSIKRVLDLPAGDSLPHWNYNPAVSIENIIARGSTSYHDWVQIDAPAGTDTKIYVATIRGLFPGMFITANGWSVVERLAVKSLGYDKEKKLWYVLCDTNKEIKKGTILSNKNHVNILKLDTHSHNENQTFDLCLWRHNYSQGDNYLIDARFKYMGDIHSTAGDENGVIIGAFVEGMVNGFHAEVKAWDPATGELQFTKAAADKTLGSGRPIINVNPTKSITAGTVLIVKPGEWTEDSSKSATNPIFQGKTYPTTIGPNALGHNSLHVGGLIRLSKDAPVTADCIGRYFAVNQEDEFPQNSKTRRWYLIDSVMMHPDGTKDIRIIRHWWGAKAAGSPTLYNPDSYSFDGHEKPLKYIIAPGANAYDVSDALPGVGTMATLRLAPTPFTGTAVDFAPGDAIEQAIGPDPFHPQTLRTWTWDHVPGIFPAAYFDVRNHGEVQRHSVMTIRGGSGNLATDIEKRWTHTPVYDRLFDLNATSNNAIIFNGDVSEAAISFRQPNGRAQPIKWLYGDELVKKAASLTVSPTDGTIRLEGGAVAATGGLAEVAGLSGSPTKANNLRGINVPVKQGSKEIAVTFQTPEADANYAVFVESSFLSQRAIAARTPEGFTVVFETAPAADARIDWMLVR